MSIAQYMIGDDWWVWGIIAPICLWGIWFGLREIVRSLGVRDE